MARSGILLSGILLNQPACSGHLLERRILVGWRSRRRRDFRRGLLFCVGGFDLACPRQPVLNSANQQLLALDVQERVVRSDIDVRVTASIGASIALAGICCCRVTSRHSDQSRNQANRASLRSDREFLHSAIRPRLFGRLSENFPRTGAKRLQRDPKAEGVNCLSS